MRDFWRRVSSIHHWVKTFQEDSEWNCVRIQRPGALHVIGFPDEAEASGVSAAPYSQPVTLPREANQRLKAYAEDAAGNTSGLIDTVYTPEPDIGSAEGSALRIAWPIADLYLLEEAESPTGPWTAMTGTILRGATDESIIIPPGPDPRKFYRLRSRTVTK